MLLNKIESVLCDLGFRTMRCERVELKGGSLVLEDAVKFTLAAFSDRYITIEDNDLICRESNGDIVFLLDIRGLPDYKVCFDLGLTLGERYIKQEERARNIINDQVEKLAVYVNRGSALVEPQLCDVKGMLTMAYFLDMITGEEYKRMNAECMEIVNGKC